MFNQISSSKYQKPNAYGTVDSLPLDDKFDRKNVHQIIRKVFCGKLESAHTEGNIVRCRASNSAMSRKGKPPVTQVKPNNRSIDWEKRGGHYMHFTLYKENRDSGDCLGYLASKLNIRGQKLFDVAGLKDKRAVTAQRVSAYHLSEERFLHLNKVMNQSVVGDCRYSREKLSLGDLAGNEFTITLRDCAVRIPDSDCTTIIPEDIDFYITRCMRHLRERGFINYYGLQRFGSFATGTHTIGQYIINGDYQAAVEKILEFSPTALKAAEDADSTENVSQDDKKRAQAINWFNNKSADIKKILDTLPRRFVAEHAIVSYLSKADNQSKPNNRGALESIPRGIRSLYPHAYQSLVWNLAASHRWRLAPGTLLVGDLILASRAPSRDTSFHVTKYDAQGDPIFEPNIHDRASIHEQYEGDSVYILTKADILSDHYSIFDVVLPQPGHSIDYPSHMLDFYTSAMQEHGNINPLKMRRSWRDASLPGAYRKLLGRPFENYTYQTVLYDDEEAKLTLTDLERLEMRKVQAAMAAALGISQSADPLGTAMNPRLGIMLASDIQPGPRLAVILKFQLPSSTYATMALRELMKPGPVEYKPEFSNGRVM